MVREKIEQLTSELSIELTENEEGNLLSNAQKLELFTEIFGEDLKRIKTSVVEVKRKGQKNLILIYKQITYLGYDKKNKTNRMFKKRIQLSKGTPKIYEAYKDTHELKLIGIYHYKGNVVFADFEIEKYMGRKSNHSSAHVFTNDLYQGMKNGVFSKIDRNGNKVTTIRKNRFKDYIINDYKGSSNELFEHISEFNKRFEFGKWIEGIEAIKKMYDDDFSQWRQPEWGGFFLENELNNYIIKENCENVIKYLGNIKRAKGEYNYDVFFPELNFYGDLKASTKGKKEAPGNDKEYFMECLMKYEKFWYVIYEHETILDKNAGDDYFGTKQVNAFLNEKKKEKDDFKKELSYFSRMKRKIKFTNMFILEINKINYREILSDFNQGKQTNGAERNKKLKIMKNNIDNFLVFNYEYKNEVFK